ncbi:MAG: DUF962 domain-containing protein, partial [Leptolyngbya sp. SIO3F4]|nr:DUF962 domain-containing protein [Leptolyngbya sp. SIO3F4]
MKGDRYESFEEFYPFYLSEHKHATSRKLHFIGTGLFFMTTVYALVEQRWGLLLLGPVF